MSVKTEAQPGFSNQTPVNIATRQRPFRPIVQTWDKDGTRRFRRPDGSEVFSSPGIYDSEAAQLSGGNTSDSMTPGWCNYTTDGVVVSGLTVGDQCPVVFGGSDPQAGLFMGAIDACSTVALAFLLESDGADVSLRYVQARTWLLCPVQVAQSTYDFAWVYAADFHARAGEVFSPMTINRQRNTVLRSVSGVGVGGESFAAGVNPVANSTAKWANKFDVVRDRTVSPGLRVFGDDPGGFGSILLDAAGAYGLAVLIQSSTGPAGSGTSATRAYPFVREM